MRLLNEIRKADHIVVYGAGDYGNIVTKWMLNHIEFAEKNIWTAVTRKGSENQLNTFCIRQIDQLCEIAEDCLVIIAVSSEKQEDMKRILDELGFSRQYYMSQQLYDFMKREVDYAERLQEVSLRVQKDIEYSEEILWGMNFNRLIKDSDWCISQDITSGGAAVGYYYLYIMYKILNSGKFRRILDIGMGQTSKVIGQYAAYNSEVSCTIVESDKEWIDFFSPELRLGANTEIIQMDYKFIEKNHCRVRVFEQFKKKLEGAKYDFISIDAPVGCDMSEYSRIDILDLLPECLEDSWIIMIDDTDRKGENWTVESILHILQKKNMKYNIGRYKGKKEFTIITSLDNRFFCTV